MQVMNWIPKLINSRFSIVLLLSIFLFSCNKSNITEYELEDDIPTLVVTNWREAPEAMEVLNKVFMDENPDIKVEYISYGNTDYDKETMFTLNAGIAPDIIYLWSYDRGLAYYETGYLTELNDLLPELKNFPIAPLKAWSTADDKIYAVPSLGVVHGVFYNKRIFKENNLTIPKDWNAFLELCRILKSKEILPFAFGSAETWYLYEVYFSSLGANFYGGEATRQKILNKEILLNDPIFINTFEKLGELIEFFPENYMDIGYTTMGEMFANEEAAMYIGGSWETGTFVNSAIDFDSIGFFAAPVETQGDKLQYSFHVDIGVAMNSTSRYPEAAKRYIEWVSSQNYAGEIMDVFPGFFSYTPGEYNLENALTKDMESYIADSEPTVRLLWEKLSAETPTGNELLGEAVKGYLNGTFSSEDAVNYVNNGLSWYYK